MNYVRSQARASATLSESFHRQLNMYALAASAAGVSVLALAQPAESKVIYTAARVKIGFGGVQEYKLDLNHDGKYDFTISTYQSISDVLLGVGGRKYYYANKVATIRPRGAEFAAALLPEKEIGPTRHFTFGANMLEDQTFNGTITDLLGPWVNVRNRYLGLKFKYGGMTHYGWARLSVTAGPLKEVTALLTGYAYETIPNKAIIAGQTSDEVSDDGPRSAAVLPRIPQPATLGLLALGSPALSIWRKEEAASLDPTTAR